MTKRYHSGRYQFIFDLGFDYTDWSLGLSATYLDPWEMEEMRMFGFWCFKLEIVFVEFTINVTDKTFRRDKIRYRPDLNQ